MLIDILMAASGYGLLMHKYTGEELVIEGDLWGLLILFLALLNCIRNQVISNKSFEIAPKSDASQGRINNASDYYRFHTKASCAHSVSHRLTHCIFISLIDRHSHRCCIFTSLIDCHSLRCCISISPIDHHSLRHCIFISSIDHHSHRHCVFSSFIDRYI